MTVTPPPRQGATGAEIAAWAARYTGVPYALGPDVTSRLEALAAAGNPQLAALAQGLGEWGRAVSAQLTATMEHVIAAYAPALNELGRALAPLAALAEEHSYSSGRRARTGDPCGNPHPPFTGRPDA